ELDRFGLALAGRHLGSGLLFVVRCGGAAQEGEQEQRQHGRRGHDETIHGVVLPMQRVNRVPGQARYQRGAAEASQRRQLPSTGAVAAGKPGYTDEGGSATHSEEMVWNLGTPWSWARSSRTEHSCWTKSPRWRRAACGWSCTLKCRPMR